MLFTLLTFCLCPAFIGLARRLGAVDFPDKERKIQKFPVARFGGLAILAAIIPALFALRLNLLQLLSLSVLLAGSFFDDILTLKPSNKLFVQAFGAVLLVSSFGFSHRVMLFDVKVPGSSPILVFLLELLIVLALINGFNLIDGANGLCSTAAVVSFLSVAVFLGSRAALCVVFAILGFLPYNLTSRMYLGDVGTSLFGFLASYYILSRAPDDALRLELLFLFSLPTLEALTSFLRRSLLFKNPFKADRNHLHHLLLSLGFSDFSVSSLSACFCAISTLPIWHIGNIQY